MIEELGKRTFRERLKVRRLIRRLHRHRDAATRQLTLYHLGKIGGPQVGEAVAHAAQHDDSEYVRNSALVKLAQLDATSYVGLFHAALSDPYAIVQKTAIEGLIAVGDPRFAEDVAAFLGHELHSMRRTAATALHDWGWATNDVRRVRVAFARLAWDELDALGAEAVAEVIRLIGDDRYWTSSTSSLEESREKAIQALERLIERHVAALSDAELRAITELGPYRVTEWHTPDGNYPENSYRSLREVDLSNLRLMCSEELKRRLALG